jgi:hypothetical protein
MVLLRSGPQFGDLARLGVMPLDHDDITTTSAYHPGQLKTYKGEAVTAYYPFSLHSTHQRVDLASPNFQRSQNTTLTMEKAKATMKKGLEKVTKTDQERKLLSPRSRRLRSSAPARSPSGSAKQEQRHEHNVAYWRAAQEHDRRAGPAPCRGDAFW